MDSQGFEPWAFRLQSGRSARLNYEPFLVCRPCVVVLVGGFFNRVCWAFEGVDDFIPFKGLSLFVGCGARRWVSSA